MARPIRDPKDELLAALVAAEGPSEFCVAGALPPALPGLDVKGLGPIALPISPPEARKLIAQATRAPYGRGEETIVDTDVRSVWQIDPKRLTLKNLAWTKLVGGLVETVKTELGVEGTVKAQLYKLLIYEKGSFFTPHRDSEKADGMFATLVVGLPSKHLGGALRVEHDSQTRTVEFGGPRSEFEIQYAAFYTDCRHEILPVTQGYRVCLVYNLLHTGRTRAPRAPRASNTTATVARLLGEVFADPKRDRIAIPLKHEYTPAGLKLEHLKGSDRNLVQTVFRTAELHGYHAHLALMSFRQVGEADYDDMGRGRWDDDLDDAGIGEVYEEELTLDGWLDPRGKKVSLGEMELEKDDVLLGSDFKDLPFEKEVTEASGNEGVTVERSYHGTVVALWPDDRHFKILAGLGQAAALPALESLLASAKSPEELAGGKEFAREILKKWRPSGAHGRQPDSKSMIRMLVKLGDVDLARMLVRDVLANDHQGSEGPELARLADVVGWTPLAKALTEFIKRQDPADHRAALGPTMGVFAGLCTARGSLTPERLSVCRELAVHVGQLMTSWDGGRTRYPSETENASRARALEGLIRALAAIDEGPRLKTLLEFVLRDAAHYDLHGALVPAVQALPSEGGSPALTSARQVVLDHCVAELARRVKTPPEEPGDWRVEKVLKCPCKDCRELQTFLRDPVERVRRLPLSKERRKHIHRQIDSYGIELTHETDRRTSPNTLVCTKTRTAYEKTKAQFASDQRVLAQLTRSPGKTLKRAASPRRPRPAA